MSEEKNNKEQLDNMDVELSDKDYDTFLENYQPNTVKPSNNFGLKIVICVLSGVIICLIGVICSLSGKTKDTANDIINYMDKDRKLMVIDTDYKLYTALKDTKNDTSKVLYDYITTHQKDSIKACKNIVNYFFGNTAEYTNDDYDELLEVDLDDEDLELGYYESIYNYVCIYGAFIKELDHYTKDNDEIRSYLFQDIDDKEKFYKVNLVNSYINLDTCTNRLLVVCGYTLPATSYEDKGKIPAIFAQGMVDAATFDFVVLYDEDTYDGYDILLYDGE